MTENSTLLTRVFDQLASDIVSGTYMEGSTFTLNDICDRFGISRTVAREAMRALEQVHMVRSSRRVGITVLPQSEWSVFDPRVIAHRLGNAEELPHQLRSLTELRIAVEPVAAAAMADHATEEEREELLTIAKKLRRLGETGRGDSREFLTLDIEFHILILRSSRNEMFSALAPAVAEVLKGRTQFGLQPAHPAAEALDRHDAVAESIQRGDRAAAEMHSRALLTEVTQALADV
ncbi:FadR/GntR family transcriptional regulator [Corynebacterium choanae]|uniref:Transcriptional regulator NanR n=1 Tax=Corynebacterium choanae TaxID=1862358 RepID=A0A3G6J4Q2_9CORY|nr:FCD domain-containing protein [Corynebacterium choanae]AZA12872.1 transcriptional regulator NanR [Corynebacterium choanae]